ncbi:hypothetical protein [Glycomyces sp. YM15]|uniref:hypothetical protein n=1 Tax=Glycomyces sp. YM15 TaxID=2800446 RepID=UPI0019648D96|nr:hypothetical protein [Glycomyces sp. YM15]
MPSYQDALSAQPSEFLTYASEMTAAASDLATQQTDYGAKVAEINSHWSDSANDAFNGEVGNVNAHLTQVIGEVTATAGGLAATAAQMLVECTGLKAADAALKAIGFNIQPAPMVTLGPAQRTAIAMAGPFGGILEAALQAQAMAGTLGLQALTSLINAADASAGAALTQAAELLKPLDDKSNAARDMNSHKAAEDHSTAGTEGANEDAAEEEDEEQQEEEQDEETQEEQQDQQEPTQPQDQQPTTPETPSGMEDLAQPETPEMPELDNPWDASELEDPEDISGGLASGGGGMGGGLGGGAGGLGAGLPAGGSPSGGGMGTATMLGTPAGGAPAGTGAKAGAGGMMGGGGGRGAGGKQDEEVERESFLVEDPEEDVWGIGKDDDNP